MFFQGEHIWLIGASSGIGEALSKVLSDQGAILTLSARRESVLVELRERLGQHHHMVPVDVSDGHQVFKALEQVKQYEKKIDRVIFLAAIYKPADIDKRDVNFAKKLIEVNLLGAIQVAYAILPVFEAQKSGQLVLFGSVAGYTGLPGGQPYSATKAAIINFAESLYAEVGPDIDIKLVDPGFVRTRMTDKNRFHMPARIEPKEAAEAVAKGLRSKTFEIHFPKRFTYWAKWLRLLPYSLKLYLTCKLSSRAE